MNSRSLQRLFLHTRSFIKKGCCEHGKVPWNLYSPSCSFTTTSSDHNAWKPYIVDKVSDIMWPDEGVGELREVRSGPEIPAGEEHQKQSKRMVESRGPELIHTELIHKQFGIVALDGGRLFQKHFAMIRTIVNRHMNSKRFAVWRVDDPWLPFTKKRTGSRLGGGKGKLKEHITPIRAGRVILEVGGIITTQQAQAFLADIAGRMPFDAKFVTEETMEAERQEAERIRRENINPYDWDFLLKWNMQNCSSFMNYYDYASKGKTRI